MKNLFLGGDMKFKLFLIYICYGLTISVYAQTSNICGFQDESGLDPLGIFSYGTDVSALAEFEPIVFNVYFWGINPETGTVPVNRQLTEEKCLISISQLNRVYNDFDIFFKYHGMDNSSFNSDVYYELTIGESLGMFGYAANEGYKKTDAFNVYVATGGTVNFGGIARGYNRTGVAVHYNFHVEDDLMVHEVGHSFNLRHTHRNWYVGHLYPDDFCEYFVDCADCPEHVTRDETDPEYNAKTTGDYVTDTQAMPDFYYEYCQYNSANDANCPNTGPFYVYVDPLTFDYIGNGKDCLGVDYLLDDPEDVKNYMAYVPSPPELFFLNFTDGQKVRMLESISFDEFGEFMDAQTDIPALYKPYKGSYTANGTIFGPQIPPTFQPGFDYEFVSCGPYGDYPPPLDYLDTSFWYLEGGLFNYSFSKDIPATSFPTIVHKNNFAIKIGQLNNAPRNCYSATGPASDGIVMKFEDEVFNNNITITPQDSTAINNPSLVDDLQPGLYKIEKNHGGGAIEETIIYKEN